MENLPNFIVIGAAKSGTTSLADYLKQHPDVYFSDYKEPNYFALVGESLNHPGPVSTQVQRYLFYRKSLTDYDAYVASYAGVTDEKAIGDASVRYLYYPRAAQRIREKIPDVRLVAILREPVSRLYSHYCMNIQYQIEPLEILPALDAEAERKAAGWGWDWHYAGVSQYSGQIKRYFELFDREQIKVFLYDDFVADPLGVYQAICRHIRVDDSFVPDMSKRGKVGSRPKNLALDRWLHWPNRSRSLLQRCVPYKYCGRFFSYLDRLNSQPIAKLDERLRKQIAPRFKDDIDELEALLGRKIPWGDGGALS